MFDICSLYKYLSNFFNCIEDWNTHKRPCNPILHCVLSAKHCHRQQSQTPAGTELNSCLALFIAGWPRKLKDCLGEGVSAKHCVRDAGEHVNHQNLYFMYVSVPHPVQSIQHYVCIQSHSYLLFLCQNERSFPASFKGAFCFMFVGNLSVEPCKCLFFFFSSFFMTPK